MKAKQSKSSDSIQPLLKRSILSISLGNFQLRNFQLRNFQLGNYLLRRCAVLCALFLPTLSLTSCSYVQWPQNQWPQNQAPQNQSPDSTSSRISEPSASTALVSRAELGTLASGQQSSEKGSSSNSTAASSVTKSQEATNIFNSSSDAKRYLAAGTLILSMRIPERDSQNSSAKVSTAENGKPAQFAPLIGYFPPAVSYVPAENETWLEISREQQQLTLFKGKNIVKKMNIEGTITLDVGDYFLQHKQKNPLWYAPNEYFAKRQLRVPNEEDRLRYRRGALGKFALFPTNTFPIHSAPVWTSEVGGLRVSEADLHSIFLMIPVGAPVVVK